MLWARQLLFLEMFVAEDGRLSGIPSKAPCGFFSHGRTGADSHRSNVKVPIESPCACIHLHRICCLPDYCRISKWPESALYIFFFSPDCRHWHRLSVWPRDFFWRSCMSIIHANSLDKRSSKVGLQHEELQIQEKVDSVIDNPWALWSECK